MILKTIKNIAITATFMALYFFGMGGLNALVETIANTL